MCEQIINRIEIQTVGAGIDEIPLARRLGLLLVLCRVMSTTPPGPYYYYYYYYSYSIPYQISLAADPAGEFVVHGRREVPGAHGQPRGPNTYIYIYILS